MSQSREEPLLEHGEWKLLDASDKARIHGMEDGRTVKQDLLYTFTRDGYTPVEGNKFELHATREPFYWVFVQLDENDNRQAKVLLRAHSEDLANRVFEEFLANTGDEM